MNGETLFPICYICLDELIINSKKKLNISKGEKCSMSLATMKNMKEFMTTKEAAEYTGISKSQLAKLRHAGRGCAYVRIGESPTKAIIRYRKSDLDEWLLNNMIRTTGGL